MKHIKRFNTEAAFLADPIKDVSTGRIVSIVGKSRVILDKVNGQDQYTDGTTIQSHSYSLGLSNPMSNLSGNNSYENTVKFILLDNNVNAGNNITNLVVSYDATTTAQNDKTGFVKDGNMSVNISDYSYDGKNISYYYNNSYSDIDFTVIFYFTATATDPDGNTMTLPFTQQVSFYYKYDDGGSDEGSGDDPNMPGDDPGEL